MITNSKQKWEVGETVKVGFLSLIVKQKVPTPNDYMPDEYILQNAKGALYSFVPHHGLVRI